MFLGKIFRWITGTKNCESIKELSSYIKVGDIVGLQYWVSQVIWYKKDVKKEEEWEPVEITLKTKQGDCEQKALISFHVINSWKGWTARLLGVYNKDNKGHAVCAFEKPDGTKGYCDDGGITLIGRGQWERLAKAVAYPNATWAA